MKHLFFLLPLMSFSLSLHAWGPTGHRVISEVAYHYLSPEACADVDEVLGTHGLVYWSNWPDELKSDANLYPTSYDWHFQDLPEGLTTDQLAYLRMTYPTHTGRLWTTLDQLLNQLPSHPTTLLINEAQMPYRDALAYLIHLTGDELCPLHMARVSDKGGNDTKVQWKGVTTNLHKVWDEKIIESRGFSYTEYAQMLIDTYGSEMDSIANLSEQDFISYVYTTTQAIYDYQTKGDDNVYHYIWHWKTTCDHLLFMAGVRLANNIQSIR